MKKLFLLVIVLIIFGFIVFPVEGFIYPGGVLMAMLAMGTIHLFRDKLLQITRWAKAKPGKAQVLITILLIIILAVGFYTGYNLFKAGYEVPGSAAFIFGTIMITGFLFVPFLPKNKTIAIPSALNKQRLAYLGIVISSYMLMVLTGNRVEERYPGSPVTRILASIDNVIFPGSIQEDEEYTYQVNEEMSAMAVFASFPSSENTPVIEPPTDPVKELKTDKKALKNAKKLEKKKQRMMKRLERRMGLAAGTSAGSVVLIILLIISLCAGICLIIGGFSGSAALIPLGALVTAGSIWGLVKVIGGDKRKDNTSQ